MVRTDYIKVMKNGADRQLQRQIYLNPVDILCDLTESEGSYIQQSDVATSGKLVVNGWYQHEQTTAADGSS